MKYLRPDNSSISTEPINKDKKKSCIRFLKEEMFSLLTLPVELQTKIFIYAQNPRLAFVCRHFQNLADSTILKAQYLIYRYGSRSALSERSLRRKIASPAVIESLLKQYNCDPTADEFWLLKHACQSKQLDICRWVIEIIVEAKVVAIESVLNIAATYGTIEVVDILVEDYHVDIHRPNGNEMALQIATLYNQASFIEHLCERYQSNLHVDNEYLLRFASFHGFFDLVKYFISKGANVQAYNNASLASSVHQGHSRVVELLLKAGAPAGINNNFCARFAILHLKDITILKHLILLGGINPRFDDDWMLLQACKRGFVDLLKFLLTDVMVNELESMVNIRNGILLKKAIAYKQIPVLQLLLSLGADVNSHGCLAGLSFLLNSPDRSKMTSEIIKLVVDKGLNLTDQNNVIQHTIKQLLEKNT